MYLWTCQKKSSHSLSSLRSYTKRNIMKYEVLMYTFENIKVYVWKCICMCLLRNYLEMVRLHHLVWSSLVRCSHPKNKFMYKLIAPTIYKSNRFAWAGSEIFQSLGGWEVVRHYADFFTSTKIGKILTVVLEKI